MKRNNLLFPAAALLPALLMLAGLCACGSAPEPDPASMPPKPQEETPAEGFDLLHGYWVSSSLAYSDRFDGEMDFETGGRVQLNSYYDGTWRIADGLLYIDDGGALRGEVCYAFESDGEKTLTLRYMPGTAEEQVNTYCHRPEVNASTTMFLVSKSDAEVEKLYQNLSRQLVGDWENIRPTLDYYWEYMRIRSDGSISVQAGAQTYDTDWYFDAGYFCFKTDRFENKYTLYIDEDYMSLHTDASAYSPYDAYYNKVGGETEGAIIPSGTHLYYAPEDFDESTATTEEAAIYLVGNWLPEDEARVPSGFPSAIRLRTSTENYKGQTLTSYYVDLDGETRTGDMWFLRDGKIGLSNTLNTTYYFFELRGDRLTLSRHFTSGDTGVATYIRD